MGLIYKRQANEAITFSFYFLPYVGVYNNQNYFEYDTPDAGHSGRAVWGEGLGRLVAGIVGSNPAQGMDVCPLSFCVVLFCVGRGLATGWSLVQGVLPYV
jgi:hypothetical protein